MKRIFIVANSYKTIYNFRIELIKRLIDLNHEVILVVPKDIHNSLFNQFNVKVYEISISRFGVNPVTEFFIIRKLYLLIKSLNPEVILSFTIKPNLYIGFLKSLFKFHFNFIPTITGLGKVFQSSFTSIPFSIFYKYSFKRANKIIFQNKSNLQLFKLRRIITNVNRSIIVNGSGINLENYTYSEPNSTSKKNFLMISRIRKDKGIDEFLQLIEKSSILLPNSFFGLIGWIEDKKYEYLIRNYSKYKNFKYYGELTQEQVKQKIIEFDCLIHPSHHEGMSNVILEAAALGRPSIASNIPGCNDIIEDGKSGLLFEVKKVDDLLEKVVDFTNLDFYKREKMGIHANKIVKEKFDRNIVINQYLIHL